MNYRPFTPKSTPEHRSCSSGCWRRWTYWTTCIRANSSSARWSTSNRLFPTQNLPHDLFTTTSVVCVCGNFQRCHPAVICRVVMCNVLCGKVGLLDDMHSCEQQLGAMVNLQQVLPSTKCVRPDQKKYSNVMN